MSQEPDFEGLLRSVLDGSWKGLNDIGNASDAEAAKRNQRMKAVAEDVLWMAQQPQGRRILEWLLNQTLRKPTWYGDLRVTVEQAASYGLFREGQNSIARMFLEAIAFGTGGDLSILHQPTGAPEHAETRLAYAHVFARARRWFGRRGWRRRR